MSANPSSLSGPSQGPSLLNLEQLETLVVLGRVDYLDLLNDVSQSVPVQLDHIRAAIAGGQASQLAATAHELRGMLLYFGCDAMTGRLGALEAQPVVAAAQAGTIHAELLSVWQQTLAAIQLWEKTVPGFAP